MQDFYLNTENRINFSDQSLENRVAISELIKRYAIKLRVLEINPKIRDSTQKAAEVENAMSQNRQSCDVGADNRA